MSRLFHGFPRTAAGREAYRAAVSAGEDIEKAAKRFLKESPQQQPPVKKYRGRPNKYGVRGLSRNERWNSWVGEVYLKDERITFSSKSREEVEAWLNTKNSERQ